MLALYKNGITSVILRMKVLDSSQTYPKGLTGLTFSSTGLIISTIANNESTATAYTAAGSTIETITTLGTFAAPTATKCRFKEVDATNHPGLYEIQIADARWAVSNARSVIVTATGATNMVQTDALVQLTNTGLEIDVNAAKVGGTTQTGRDLGASVLLSSGTGTGQVNLSNGNVTVATNNDKTGYSLSQSFPSNFSALAITSNGNVSVGTNNDKTGYALTTGERTSVADAILDRDMSVGTDSGSATVRTPRQALRALRNKVDTSSGSLSVYKEDDSTASWTATLAGNASAAPIVTVDPAGP